MTTQLYDAYGQLMHVRDGSGQELDPEVLADDPYGYKGRLGYETDLILCTYRYYDPQLGRWLTRDPIGYDDGLNMYRYCGNNPVTWMDSSGLKDTTTPWDLGMEWLTGTGPRVRYFKDGDSFTELLRKHSHIEETRELISERIAGGQLTVGEAEPNPYSLAGLQGAPKFLSDYATLFTGGLTGNLAATYLGSYTVC